MGLCAVYKFIRVYLKFSCKSRCEAITRQQFAEWSASRLFMVLGLSTAVGTVSSAV